MKQQLIIAIDPGREKCGIAVVHKEKGILHKEIIHTPDLNNVVEKLITTYQTNTLILGDRTTSKEAKSTLEKLSTSENHINIITVNEHRSTDEARQRYWIENPPRGLKRLIPLGLQVPPGPIDDYVAVILAERYFD